MLHPVHLNLEVQKIKKLLERTLSKMIKIEFDLAKELKIIYAVSLLSIMIAGGS